MHTIFALMIMSCYSGKSCKAITLEVYETQDACLGVAHAMTVADDRFMPKCQKIIVEFP